MNLTGDVGMVSKWSYDAPTISWALQKGMYFFIKLQHMILKTLSNQYEKTHLLKEYEKQNVLCSDTSGCGFKTNILLLPLRCYCFGTIVSLQLS